MCRLTQTYWRVYPGSPGQPGSGCSSDWLARELAEVGKADWSAHQTDLRTEGRAALARAIVRFVGAAEPGTDGNRRLVLTSLRWLRAKLRRWRARSSGFVISRATPLR